MSEELLRQLSVASSLTVAQLFMPRLRAIGSFELIRRCGESIAVLDEGFKHLNQATHLAKVSTVVYIYTYVYSSNTGMRFKTSNQLCYTVHVLGIFGCKLEWLKKRTSFVISRTSSYRGSSN